jgi:hypothetical protein
MINQELFITFIIKPKGKLKKKIKEIAISKNCSIGQDRIQIELIKRFNIKLSTSTINIIMHDLNLIKKRLKKYQRKRQIREYKKEIEGFEILANRY